MFKFRKCVHIYPKHLHLLTYFQGFPGGSVVKNPPDSVGATGNRGSVPGLGRFPGGGNGNTLQDSGWANPMDRGAWWVNPCGRKEFKQELNTTKRAGNILSNLLCFICCKQHGRPPMSKLFCFCFVYLFGCGGS